MEQAAAEAVVSKTEGRKSKFEGSGINDCQLVPTEQDITGGVILENEVEESQEKFDDKGTSVSQKESSQDKIKAVDVLECQGERNQKKFEEPGGSHNLENSTKEEEHTHNTLLGDDEQNDLVLKSFVEAMTALECGLHKSRSILANYQASSELMKDNTDPEYLAVLIAHTNIIKEQIMKYEQMRENLMSKLSELFECRSRLNEVLHVLYENKTND